MMHTVRSKNGYLNKLVIYQQPLLESVLSILSAIGLLALAGAYLVLTYSDNGNVAIALVLLIASLSYAFFAYYSIFQNYICADFQKNKLIIHTNKNPEEISFDHIQSIICEHNAPNRKEFAIKINMGGSMKRIDDWSEWMCIRILLFNRYERQFSRVEKFCKQVNQFCIHGRQ